MRVKWVGATNFASYSSIRISLLNKGLTLVHGATGSGKSTLCDLVPWCLFGRTAKDGAVDEVLSWTSDESAWVSVLVETSGGQPFWVRRIRGRKAGENDLAFAHNVAGVDLQRGKDLVDTQKLINHHLGVDLELYLASAYFHEFSQTAGFFTATAKQRRTICEQIVDLSLPKKLLASATEQRKVINTELESVNTKLLKLEASIASMKNMEKSTLNSSKVWVENNAKHAAMLTATLEEFNANYDKQVSMLFDQIEKLKKEYSSAANDVDSECPTCGSKNPAAHSSSLHNNNIDRKIAALTLQAARLPTADVLKKELSILQSAENPCVKAIKSIRRQNTDALAEQDSMLHKAEKLITTVNDYDTLVEVAAQARAMLIGQAIADIEDRTNTYLSKHFDAEIKVSFQVEDADKLLVDISKDGNACAYTQLSKGQRQLLKLCFGVAVMKQAANNSLTNFTQLFFDESLSGLDDSLKVKAFNLFNHLSTEYESVFVIEHSSDFKELFTNKIKVQLIDNKSEIYEDL